MNHKNGLSDNTTVKKVKELCIGKTLTLLLEKRRMTVKELSFKSGVPQKTIYHLLSGRKGDIQTIEKLAEAFNVSLHYILYGCPDTRETNVIGLEDLFSGHFEIVVRKRTNENINN